MTLRTRRRIVRGVAALVVAAFLVLPACAFADATVTTGSASAVSQTQATLNGTVDPQGVPTDYQLRVRDDDLVRVGRPGPASCSASRARRPWTWWRRGLAPDTEYHFRLLALRLGTVVATGEDQTFTTHAVPSISVDDVRVTEGDVGTTDVTFTVSLSAASDQTVTVDYATGERQRHAAGRLLPGERDTDASRPGETSKTVTVQVNGDTLDENDEGYTLGLSEPGQRDDRRRQRRRHDHRRRRAGRAPRSTTSRVTEGDTGTTTATFTVTLSAASGQHRHRGLRDRRRQRHAARRLRRRRAGTLTFAPGETSKTITSRSTATRSTSRTRRSPSTSRTRRTSR